MNLEVNGMDPGSTTKGEDINLWEREHAFAL